MTSKSNFAVSIAFATCALFCPKPASARSANNPPAFDDNNVPSAVAQQEADQMVPAQAVLAQDIDAKKMQSGQQFQAKLTDTVHLKNGVDLPRGTELVGTIATDKMKSDGSSTLALRFTKADLKGGKVVPIEATIVAIAPPEYGDVGNESYNAAPMPWNGKSLRVDQMGAISGFDLHSGIADQNSAVFVSAKKDHVKLSNQTQLSLAIASLGTSQMSGE